MIDGDVKSGEQDNSSWRETGDGRKSGSGNRNGRGKGVRRKKRSESGLRNESGKNKCEREKEWERVIKRRISKIYGRAGEKRASPWRNYESRREGEEEWSKGGE